MNLAAPITRPGHRPGMLPFFRLACVLLCATIASVAAPRHAGAQSDLTGTLTGVVSDPSGGVLPGVTVDSNSRTGLTQQTVTGGEGDWRIPALPPGV